MIIFVVISAIVAKLNRLLDQLNVSSRLKTVVDIGAGVYVTAYLISWWWLFLVLFQP